MHKINVLQVDSCERLEDCVDVGEVDSAKLPTLVSRKEESASFPPPPPSRRGLGRSTQHRAQGHKPHGGYGRQPGRNTEQGGDGRFWSGGRGGSRGMCGGGRGRGGGGGNSRYVYHHHSSRIISDPQDYNGMHYKDNCMIDSGYGTKANGKPRDSGMYVNGRVYSNSNGDNRGHEFGSVAGGGGGGGRKGPKSSGNRQRYGPGRGRGRGPPPGFAPSSFRHSAQDWS